MQKFALNVNEIMDHVSLIHDIARRADAGGRIVVASYGEDHETGEKIPPKVRHFRVGDTAGTKGFIESLQKERHRNVYMPLTTLKPGMKPTAKGGIDDIETVMGLVADFDDDRALEYEDRLPLPPDIVLETSQGRYQCLYLFDGGLPPAEAIPLAQALQRHCGCDHGTADISHVWRVPGCLNWPNRKKVTDGRSPEPQAVRSIVDWDGESFTDPQALSEALGGVEKPKPKPDLRVIAADDDQLTIAAGRRPPLIRWTALAANHDTFSLSFAEKRPDLNDQSPSAYDLALASAAVLAEWTDQEIVDLMIAHREEHGHDLKLKNRQYYIRTIRTAREVEAPKEAEAASTAGAWRLINNVIDKKGDVNVVKIVRYVKENPSYKFYTNRGSFEILTTTLHSQRLTRRAIYTHTKKSTPRVKPEQWDDMLNHIEAVEEVEDLGPEATAAGLIRSHLEAYLARRWVSGIADLGDLKKGQWPVPLVRDSAGNLKMHVEGFARHLRQQGWVDTGVGDLYATLREIGLIKSSVKLGGTSFGAWKLPGDLAARVDE